MADSKISALPAATTPLAGTEVLPIVQGGVTDQVSVTNLTAGRAISALSVSSTGAVTQQSGSFVPYTLFSNAIPMILVSNGTMGNNGALSAITAIGGTYTSAYIYLPANAISTGSAAGLYYAVFSSTTAATVYNNTYTSGVPTIPSSPTAFSTTGPGSFTQSTGAQITMLSFTMPASTLGTNGVLTQDIATNFNNTANNKTITINFGASAVASLNFASQSTFNFIATTRNRGSQSSQITTGLSSQGSTRTIPTVFTTANTANSLTVTVKFQIGTATDTCTLEAASFYVNN